MSKLYTLTSKIRFVIYNIITHKCPDAEKISLAIIVRCKIKCLPEIWLHPISLYRSHCAFISLLSSLVEAIGCSNQITVQLILGARSSTFSRYASVSLHKFTWGEGDKADGNWSVFSLQEFYITVYLWGLTCKT